MVAAPVSKLDANDLELNLVCLCFCTLCCFASITEIIKNIIIIIIIVIIILSWTLINDLKLLNTCMKANKVQQNSSKAEGRFGPVSKIQCKYLFKTFFPVQVIINLWASKYRENSQKLLNFKER